MVRVMGGKLRGGSPPPHIDVQVILNQQFAKNGPYKIFISNGLQLKYSNQTSYVGAMEKPRLRRGLFSLYSV